MPRSHLSYLFLLSFLATAFALRWVEFLNVWPAVRVLAGSALLSAVIGQLYRHKLLATTIALSLGALLACLALIRVQHHQSDLTLDTYATNQFVTIDGTVAAEPDRRQLQTKYTVAADTIKTADGTIIYPIQGLVLATDQRQWPPYQYGDRVRLRGRLQQPEAIEDFAYDNYLRRYNIYSVMYRSGFSLIAAADSWQPRRWLYQLKEAFETRINQLYAEPQASFMAGLLTGSRRGIPEGLLADFSTTGLTHIIAISGYNITIITTIIMSLLFWLPLRWRLVPALLAIAGFTIFVGASAAVVRAAIMGSLGLLALHTHRQNHTRLAVLWTACFMLCWNIRYLWFDVGFQLSFLAVIGLMECAPLLDHWFARVPQTLGLRESLQMTCAAQLSAVPIILFTFGRLSLVAPLANVLVAPFIPVAMLFGFLGAIISYGNMLIGQLLAYIGWGCLQWIIAVATYTARLPYASVELTMSPLTLTLYYLILTGAVYIYQQSFLPYIQIYRTWATARLHRLRLLWLTIREPKRM